ncbi:MAG TPA: glycoside hydrolase family 97 protein [Tepidisphaeraceae bacterium]|jgi:alpha-glucosidase|nr:glycoside hydrolase family 97 protein [Tepidisphaeraceae bacterium]
MLKQILLLACVLLIVGCAHSNEPDFSVPQSFSSPDHHLSVTVATAPSLTYSLSLDNQPLLARSALGLQFQDDVTLGADSQLINAELTTSDSTWTTSLYKRESVRDHYNQLVLTLLPKSAPYATYQIAFRLYDDGLAFRYLLPRNLALNNDSLALTKELTSFTFPVDADCYAGSQAGGYAGPQEWEFPRTRLAKLPKDHPVGLPLLVHTSAAYVAITEADLLDYPGLWLMPVSDLSLQASPAPLLNSSDHALGHLEMPHATPWRVVMVGKKPGELIESDLVMNLATPSQIDSSWVKPGITAWDHWWSGGTIMNTATLKSYIQLAADMGWPYQLIDWQWYGAPNTPNSDITHICPEVDLPYLLNFAKEKKVRLLLWLHSNDVARNDAYKTAFALYEKWGIAGVKIDFMDRDDQEMVNWYEKITKAAAEHHLLVDFHGAYKPTGLNRTYPNQITREGILGNEYNHVSKSVTPEHKLTLPFTRLLLGPADFTPGGFLNRQPGEFKVGDKATEVQGTRAAELALFVLYDSPLTCACDLPEHYLNQPGADFLKIVPTVWKDLHVLQASVGEYLVEARQAHEGDFYLAAATNSQPRTLTIPLTFLGKGSYTMTLWQDAPDADKDATHLIKSSRSVASKDNLIIPLAAAGGAVARFHQQ